MATAATTPKISVALVGGTGLTGCHLAQQLVSHPSVSRVISLARRPPPTPISDPDNKLTWHTEPDSTLWPGALTTLLTTPSPTHPPVKTFFSALGTTRADAGSFAAQYKIDYDLNLSLATAARAVPSVDTYVLISTGMADPASRMPYTKMKGELERDVVALGFARTVLVRPGLIIGSREKTRFGENVAHCLERGVRGVLGEWATAGWAQPAGWIARAAGRAGVEEGVWGGSIIGLLEEGGKKVWKMEQGEIVRLAKEAAEKTS